MSQAFPIENLSTRVMTILSYPLIDRINELSTLFDRCSARQLYEIYPTLVHSIFGNNGNGIGWGLRTTTVENIHFNPLHVFFSVRGIWMYTCHRLLSDTTKFEIDIEMLPPKFVAMLQSGQASMFYADLILLDVLNRQVKTLSLNSFDFFMFHFVSYALQPLYTFNPSALQVHNERTKTVYQLLVAEYLANFLPLHTDAIIEPVNFCGIVKAAQPLPVQSLQPQRKPRYIKIPSTQQNGSMSETGNATPQPGNCSRERAYAWRTESVLHLFVDIWLRHDIESTHHLPSSDFVRGVRFLIKQIHFFASATHYDISSLSAFRKMSLTMVKTRIYPFLCSLIDRWPLDSSLVIVLELWLSYIQPWRYTMQALNKQICNTDSEPFISITFDAFLADNITVYTHIFMQMLPRFERLDYTLHRNAHMLFRMAKTFDQQDLIERLKLIERVHSGNAIGFDSPQRQANFMNKSNNYNSYNAQWNPLFSSNIPKLFSSYMHDQIEKFLCVISMARTSVIEDISVLRAEIAQQQRSAGFFKNLMKIFVASVTSEEETLKEISHIPELLCQSINIFCKLFCIDPGNLSMYESLPTQSIPGVTTPSKKLSFFDSSDVLDTSKLTQHQISLNASLMQPTIDPALLPIQSNEIKPLVNLLHGISEAINQRYGSRIDNFYRRSDFCGKLARQVLFAPMTEQWFDKRCGHTDICEKALPARLCLRPLGSLSALSMIAFALIVGKLLWGAPVLGLIALCFLFLGYILTLALCS